MISPEAEGPTVEEWGALGLPSRTVNPLKKSFRIQDLLHVPDEELLTLRNFGKKALAELRSKIPYVPLEDENIAREERDRLEAQIKATELARQALDRATSEFKIEIPAVNEELYNRTREAVEQAGYNFVVPIRSVSIADLLAEDKQRKQRGEPRRLVYVAPSKTMRATVPPEMEVAINPAKFKIEGSNFLSTDEQKKRIKAVEVQLRAQVPQDIQYLVIMEMVDPSTISQIENMYRDEHNGAVLLRDWFARTDMETVQGRVAIVGRYSPKGRGGRRVGGWRRDLGDDLVFAAAVVVLPRKLPS